ncbi:MAG: hypothetical protein K2X53_03070, partial [Alphaproteobacteria bacterium]|nr:hypothetical protein [Alphaproteobacteria bacterium]
SFARKLDFSTPKKEGDSFLFDSPNLESHTNVQTPSSSLDFPLLGLESNDDLPPDSPYRGSRTKVQGPSSGVELLCLDFEDGPAQEPVQSIFDVTEEEVEAEIPEALQFLYEGPHHTFYDPISGKMIQGKVFESTPDGDCGYTSMFLKRAAAIDNTLKMNDNMLVRSLVHKDYIGDKDSFEAYVGAARNDSSNYLRLETNVRYNRTPKDGEQRLGRLGIPVQDDLIGGVSFANNRHVVGLLHDNQPGTDVSLFPCYISKNFMNPNSRLVYLLFEGGGYHGSLGLHYNIVMPIAQPDSISEEQYKENVVIAWRAHKAALQYIKLLSENVEINDQLLQKQYGDENALAYKQIQKDKKKKARALSAQLVTPEREKQIALLRSLGLQDEQIEKIMAKESTSKVEPLDLSTQRPSLPKKKPRPTSLKSPLENESL